MRTLVRLYDRLLDVLLALVCLMIVVSTLAVAIDVVARYFFNRPLAWVFEMTEYFMLYAVFFGIAALVRRDRHVRIDIVVQSLNPRAQLVLDLICSVLATLTCGIAAYYSAISTYSHYLRKVMTYGLYPMPKWALIAGICLGFTLATVEFARRVYRRARDLRRGTAPDSPLPPSASVG